MPILHWIGKDKVVNHHHDVPFRLLKKDYTFKANENTQKNSTANRIIHGDNLEALKSLLPEFEGKINCIYIDPPYNTGNEGWVYNDNVNDPKIKKWLGEVVGKEGEDLSRHDKWLCMIYPRLKLLHRLLSDDGVIFISIDENEAHHLRCLLDEIFGKNNFIEQLVWNKRVPKNDKGIGNIHEYVLLYSKKNNKEHRFVQLKDGLDDVYELIAKCKKQKLGIQESEKKLKNLYKKNNYDRGITLYNALDSMYQIWGKINLSWPNGQTFGPRYDVIHPITKLPCKVPDRGWRWIKETFDAELDYTNIEILEDGSIKCGNIWFAKDEKTQPSYIKYLKDVEFLLLRSIISLKSSGSLDLESVFQKNIFDYPKPVELLKLLINSVISKNSIILDSFAGSGTTAHAVLKLNAEDGGSRQFICIEMMDYAETITAERVKRVMNGYGDDKKSVEGLGGGFDFYTVDAPLFLEDNNLNEEVGEKAIRNYVAYSENISSNQNADKNNAISPYTLGVNDDALYVFYYQKDKITTLDMDFLASLKIGELPKRPSNFIIYADKCVLEKEFMLKHNITFKRIPRDITRF